MMCLKRANLSFLRIIGVLALATAAPAQIVISGNETKIELTSGAPRVLAPAASDSLTILDFATFPPRVQHLDDIPNSVIGPPSNIAISPDGKLALVANSLKIDPQNSTNWVPENFVHVLNLAQNPPQIIGRASTGRQPSGISITHDGRLALVANRADGTVTVLSIRGTNVSPVETVNVCLPAEAASDVAISPDGRLALVSVQKGSYLAVLKIEDGKVTPTGQKISAYGQPYRVVITSDGELGLTAGMGFGNGLDRDAVTVVDLKAKPMRALDHVAIGAVPESIEISPDGRLLAAVVMNGSNFAASDPKFSRHGGLVLLERSGKTFRVTQEIPIGRIPEGVAFTSDGRYLVVQCHPDRELWLFSVRRGRVRDTGERIKVPGMPSSLRASP